MSLLAHRGAVRALAVDATGHHLVTAGADAQVKVWDVRTFRPLHAYFSASPAAALDISQRGMLAVAYGPHVQVCGRMRSLWFRQRTVCLIAAPRRACQVWKDALAHKASAPYLNHLVAGGGVTAVSCRFCPYDDVLGIGHTNGIASLLVRTPLLTCPKSAPLPCQLHISRQLAAWRAGGYHRQARRREGFFFGATQTHAMATDFGAAARPLLCAALCHRTTCVSFRSHSQCAHHYRAGAGRG